jgi:hypothetical protein
MYERLRRFSAERADHVDVDGGVADARVSNVNRAAT